MIYVLHQQAAKLTYKNKTNLSVPLQTRESVLGLNLWIYAGMVDRVLSFWYINSYMREKWSLADCRLPSPSYIYIYMRIHLRLKKISQVDLDFILNKFKLLIYVDRIIIRVCGG